MQKLLAALTTTLVLCLGTNAVAENSLGIPLLVKETSGGHVPPDRTGWGSKVSIYGNGKVIESYRKNADSPWKQTLLAVLSHQVIDNIEAFVAALAPGDIVFSDEPACADAPSTTYSARTANNDVIDFAATVDCRDGILGGFYDAERLKEMLDGFDSLWPRT